MLQIPQIQNLLHETAFVLLKSSRFKEAITIADRCISKHVAIKARDTSQAESSAKDSANSFTQHEVNFAKVTSRNVKSSSKKRLRSGSEMENHEPSQNLVGSDLLHCFAEDLIALKYKADALLRTMKFDDASRNLNK